jgi:cytochrome P450
MQRFTLSPRDPAFVQDPYPAYARLRALAVPGVPVWWEGPDLPVFAHHADVSALLRDRRFGREVTHLASREALGWPPIPERLASFHAFEADTLLEREPPVHTRLRRLISRAFTSRAVAEVAARADALCHGLIDGFSGEPELIAAYAEPIPLVLIAERLGAPPEASAQMRAWSNDMVAMYQTRRDRETEDRAVAATIAFSAFIAEVIAQRRRAPGAALIDDLIAARDNGEALSESELIATAILLLNAGHEATVHAIANGAKTAIEHDRTPAFAGREAAAAVEESLRFDPPLHLFTRFALEDAVLGGHQLRIGDRIGLLLGSAGRDGAVFGDPDRFDPGRANAGAHLAFGAGIHFCIGAPLARLETRIALSTLFSRWPDAALAAPPRYADRWHFHGLEALRLR